MERPYTSKSAVALSNVLSGIAVIRLLWQRNRDTVAFGVGQKVP